ncbi:RPM1-interacting protein 4-like [Corylus avellana]|uniref:RPM1-interacting protein 4-like n=1 Tax=Corylus avellana TaxID=13451 RepID=UPI00286C1100|nr:RPM1-interacting protein 4-like [Corylus avellana]
MAQNSHVPKFGNWDDNDSIPYTIYFENARKDKGGVKMMNPNDPEENPEAFMCMREGLAVNVNSNNSISSSEKQQNKGGHSRPPAHPRNNIITSSNQQKSGSHRRITSESGSERSGSDYSLMQPGHRRVRSDMKKKKNTSSDHGSNSFSTSGTRHSTSRERTAGSYSSNDHMTAHHKVASVPKFGAWDESDPKSGEGFTVIFNKVKEEKQIAATQFASEPTQSSYYSNAHGHGRSSSRSKICCCLFSSESDQ